MIDDHTFNRHLTDKIKNEVLSRDDITTISKRELFFLFKKSDRYFFYFSPLTAQVFMVDFAAKMTESDFLRSLFYLPTDMIFEPRSDMRDPWKTTKKITFLLSNDCNLSCKYCYAQPKELVKLNWEMIEAALNKKINLGCSEISLGFHGGGEPFLEIDLIKKIVSYLENKNIKVSISGQTNGFLPRPTVQWLISKKAKIGISCDGPPYIQDMHRPTIVSTSSSELVSQNIMLLAENGDLDIVLSVVSDYSVTHMTEIVSYLHSLGVKNIGFIMLDDSQTTSGLKSPDLEKYYDHFLNALEIADEFGMNISLNRGGINFSLPRLRNCSTALAFTPDGLITGCNECYSKKQHLLILSLGILTQLLWIMILT